MQPPATHDWPSGCSGPPRAKPTVRTRSGSPTISSSMRRVMPEPRSNREEPRFTHSTPRRLRRRPRTWLTGPERDSRPLQPGSDRSADEADYQDVSLEDGTVQPARSRGNEPRPRVLARRFDRRLSGSVITTKAVIQRDSPISLGDLCSLTMYRWLNGWHSYSGWSLPHHRRNSPRLHLPRQ